MSTKLSPGYYLRPGTSLIIKGVNGDHIRVHVCVAGPDDVSCCHECGEKLSRPQVVS